MGGRVVLRPRLVQECGHVRRSHANPFAVPPGLSIGRGYLSGQGIFVVGAHPQSCVGEGQRIESDAATDVGDESSGAPVSEAGRPKSGNCRSGRLLSAIGRQQDVGEQFGPGWSPAKGSFGAEPALGQGCGHESCGVASAAESLADDQGGALVVGGQVGKQVASLGAGQ